jgi:hypothetical protein
MKSEINFDVGRIPCREGYPDVYRPVVPNGRRCEITGMTHGWLYRALLHGEMGRRVRVLTLKEPGATRGKLMFHVGDALRWLDSLAEEQAKKRAEPAEACHAE